MTFFDGLAAFPFPIHLTLGLTFVALVAWIASVAYFGLRLWRPRGRGQVPTIPRNRAIALAPVYVVACLLLGFLPAFSNSFVISAIRLLLLGLVVGWFFWPALKYRSIILIFSFVLSFGVTDVVVRMIVDWSGVLSAKAIGPQWALLFIVGIQAAYALVFTGLVSVAVRDAFSPPRRAIYWAAFIGGFVPKSYVPVAILLSSAIADPPDPELLISWLYLIQKLALYLLMSLPLFLCLLVRQPNIAEEANRKTS